MMPSLADYLQQNRYMYETYYPVKQLVSDSDGGYKIVEESIPTVNWDSLIQSIKSFEFTKQYEVSAEIRQQVLATVYDPVFESGIRNIIREYQAIQASVNAGTSVLVGR